MTIVLLGASGSGKTTVGRMLANELGWRFVDADDLHPPANIAKMSRNEPLTDSDREPWLLAVRRTIAAARDPLVIACSALKRAYRRTIANGRDDVRFVYLKAREDVLTTRLAERRGHFAGPGLVASQMATLEEPAEDDATTVDATLPPERLVSIIRGALRV